MGDTEISVAAMTALVNINHMYVKAKGKTFFNNVPFLDGSCATDGFINHALEILRQDIQIGLARKNEEQLELTLRTFFCLTRVYLEIEYTSPSALKTHASLAAGYLTDAVRTISPHGMTDVMMEGVKLTGEAAKLFVLDAKLDGARMLVSEIELFSSLGSLNEKYRPVSLVGVEKLAQLSFLLILCTKNYDIGFAAETIHKSIANIARLFLEVKELPLRSPASESLRPYYSGASFESLLKNLTDLTNNILQTDASDENTKQVAKNFYYWAEKLPVLQKDLLLDAIKKQSVLSSELIHWIVTVGKLLLATATACDEDTRYDLQTLARRLLLSLSWLPRDKESVQLLEAYDMTEQFFEVAANANDWDAAEVTLEAEKMLFSWAMTAGAHSTGWATLEKSIYGLIVVSQWTGTNLIKQLEVALKREDAPSQELRDRAARSIERADISRFRSPYSLSSIDRALGKIDSKIRNELISKVVALLYNKTKGVST